MLSLFSPVFIILLVLGVPIYLTMGLTSGLVFASEGSLVPLAQKIIDELNSPTLLAVPYFVIAATFMERGGVAKALINAATAWIGRVHGGLGLVSVLTCAIFAAMCGSSVATAIAMGTIMIPAMLRNGYAPSFAGGILVSAGTLGILIPPSLAFVVYGVLADASIPRLFLGGVIPGLISATMMGVYVYFYSKKNGYVDRVPMPRDEKIKKTVNAIPALLVPVVVLGGLYGGFVTLTETAALSAVVAIALAMFVYREVKPSDFLQVMTHGVRSAAAIMIIIAMALAFGHLITETGIAQKTLDIVKGLDIQPWQFLLAVNIILIFLGMFLEVFSILLIMVPIILPLLEPLGIDPIHFGVMLVINMELALMSPPVGLNLFVISNISKIPLAQVLRGTMPFFFLMVGLLIVVTYIPTISTWLPNLLMGPG
ncbi:MAG: TRAP transporter large permease subunit [Burkholderiales bacterium]|jgi:C4-dicarboxylate transporter, DctM subunit|nr:TRAP transporter large permease subunit [Burkholderiales bacterium]MDP4909033.1 TRAP transporter large permease subunit [Burkholderiaceae bacterium]